MKAFFAYVFTAVIKLILRNFIKGFIIQNYVCCMIENIVLFKNTLKTSCNKKNHL